MTKIKICGLSRACDVEYANELRPDYAGFVINVPQSRRSVDFSEVRKLAELANGSFQKVGVFVDENPENILSLVCGHYLDLIQLHGSEDNAYIEKIKAKAEVPIIQAIGIADRRDMEKARQSIADFLLLDGKKAGSGQCFDWNLVCELEKPFFLAGGLTADNVKDAVSRVRPYAVDVSSGAELGGFKDFETMKKIIHCVRSADNE